jgi:CRISPR-associated protein Cas5d
LKGIVKSIYWKPTITWIIDDVRILHPIRTQTKGTKPIVYHSPKNELSIYTFLSDVNYQIRAHFEWNLFRPELEHDRIEGKHFAMANRMLERGGRQDIFLGTRDCQGYVEPCEFGIDSGHYDSSGEIGFGLMFHGFDYPDEIGENKLSARFTRPTMVNGVVHFERPEACRVRKFVREMTARSFQEGKNFQGVEIEALEWEG